MQGSHDSPLNKIPVRQSLVVVTTSVIATFALYYMKYSPRLPYADEFEYLGYAYGIFQHDVFGRVIIPDVVPAADSFFPPLYPFFLAMIMAMDQTFVQTTECAIAGLTGASGALAVSGCDPNYGIATPVQLLIAGLVPWLVWGTALRLSGSMKIAVFSAILAFATRSYVYYANHFLTEVLTLPLAAALGWAMVSAWQDRSIKAAAMSGLWFGLLVLTRAGWSYAALVVVPIFLWMGIAYWRERGMRAFLPILVFSTLVMGIVSPWIVRNTVQFGTPALTGGYGDRILLFRLPYNRMTHEEWKAAFVYWLPDFGDSLAKKMFPESHYKRLDFGYPEGFYTSERIAFEKEARENQGERDLQTYLIEKEIIGNLGKHVTVTFAMVWRGMFAAKYFGLIGWLFYLPVLIVAVRRQWGAFIILALPTLFMLGLNAFVSVSIPRYNLPLIPILAFSIAYGCAQIGMRIPIKRRSE